MLNISLCTFLFPISWPHSYSNLSTISNKWFKWVGFTHCNYLMWHPFQVTKYCLPIFRVYIVAKMHSTSPMSFMFNEVESSMIGLLLIFLFFILMNWFQFGYMECQTGYQCSWAHMSSNKPKLMSKRQLFCNSCYICLCGVTWMACESWKVVVIE